ncbi:MAG: hypothetical protein AAFZ15_29705 [Bacteroidota bacterium]
MKKILFFNVRSKWTWAFFTLTSFFTILFLTDCDTPASGPDTGNGGNTTGVQTDFEIDESGNITGSEFLTSTSWKVPHDVMSQNPTQEELARFAWKEFIALNWPSDYDTTTYSRGKPDQSKTVIDFLKAGEHPDLPLVWETYKHRIEVYPLDTSNYEKNFDSPPRYSYKVEGQSSIPSLDPSNKTALIDVRHVFNNLDETSEINLATLFVSGDPDAPGAAKFVNSHTDTASFLPGAPRRIIYEAKANEVFFNYVKNKKLYDTTIKKNLLTQTAIKIQARGADTLGGKCLDGNNDIISFPCGINGDDRPIAEGSIEVKASWRRLTRKEANSGRYLTSPVLYYRRGTRTTNSDSIYYQKVPATATENSLPIGLVGLHIIHKTENVPTYVFATFEQVDNLKRSQEHNDLFFFNRNDNPKIYPGVQQVTQRAHDMLTLTDTLNMKVHAEFTAVDPNTVWQYYKLIGVQGPATESQDGNNFYLANIVTETNEVLRSFKGTLDNNTGIMNPSQANTRVGPHAIITGGCKGCHANAQDADFSFITKNGPFNQENAKYSPPDVVNQPLLKGLKNN